ncbi:mannitol 2-dehydrogenase [Paractinoplanes abujensis]|uniref:Mannitol-1-phosphate 5-dehydrogenase n=1 Tax=Paractinoplanes abujensis TaxID=882441 RepID=A0A7W7D310_9ACTN|nr:mannitol dehydrogenase family protein [Actinoplanes abujensis]MBB4698390.1 fructuronate reductase/mannitol 2-dehydrogenase [Actinoplanes abujensis]GID19124.1 mannitol 2-dehydrogenase [Actinoplanes abujensis]
MDRISLSNRTVRSLADRIDVPTYDRSALVPAVVHLGVGGFHRAHQAVYFDDLARSGDLGWGVVGVGLRSPGMRDALLPQDCLFTVVESDEDGDRGRVVGAMTGYRYAPDRPAAVLDALADPRVRLVTLTVTGDGYHHPGRPVDPARPTTAAGFLVEALDRRRRAGLPGFTVLSCDNLPDNGAAARAAVLGPARLRDRALAAWIDAHVSFPASMVDRITPATGAATRRLVASRFGIDDRSPVVTEPFRQWVVEDDFPYGRPPLEQFGVHFVPDVTPYRLMKTRLLNAGHSALGYLGSLTGEYRTSSEAMTNPVIADYLAVLMREEIAPLLPKVPGIDLDAYQARVLRRFANPRISDQLSRLCGRGSTKMPAYLLPSLADARRTGRPALLLSLAVAAWFCYLRGYDLNGAPIEVRDALAETLQARARAGGNDPRPLLAEHRLFGSLAADPGLAGTLENALHDLEVYGPAATICDYLATELLTGRPVV